MAEYNVFFDVAIISTLILQLLLVGSLPIAKTAKAKSK